jgi:hypothetical protein
MCSICIGIHIASKENDNGTRCITTIKNNQSLSLTRGNDDDAFAEGKEIKRVNLTQNVEAITVEDVWTGEKMQIQ